MDLDGGKSKFQIHNEGRLKGWALKPRLFWAQKSKSAASAIWAQKSPAACGGGGGAGGSL